VGVATAAPVVAGAVVGPLNLRIDRIVPLRGAVVPCAHLQGGRDAGAGALIRVMQVLARRRCCSALPWNKACAGGAT
jgi:hypothetical protein